MSTRDLIFSLAAEMKKKPEDFQKYVDVLEENFLDEQEALNEVSDDQWKQMNVPVGLVNKIKKALASGVQTQPQVQTPAPVQQEAPAEKQITTNTVMKSSSPKRESTQDKALVCLNNIMTSDIPSGPDASAQLRGLIELLFKVLNKILQAPMEPSYRKLAKSKSLVQNKIMPFPNALAFLRVAGFHNGAEYIECKDYKPEILRECNAAISEFIQQLGGEVKKESTFNPFESSVSSTVGQPALPGSTDHNKAKFINQREKIAKIQQDREAMMETKVEDREISVFNSNHLQGRNINKLFSDLDAKQDQEARAKHSAEMRKKAQAAVAEKEASQQQEKQINTFGDGSKGILLGDATVGGEGVTRTRKTDDEDLTDEKADQMNALRFLADQEKATKFRDKAQIELEQVQKQAIHTRTKIRVKFPDGYIIQGTFGSAEKVQNIFDFVKENLGTPERQFYLFETPPKRIVKDMNRTIKAAGLSGRCLLYFGWEGLEETKFEDGPFLHMMKLKDKITVF